MKKIIILISVFIVLTINILSTQNVYKPLEINAPARLFFTQKQVRFRRLSKEALNRAEKRIDARLYSFTDPSLINTTQHQANQGVAVHVKHDLSSSQVGFQQLMKPIQCEGILSKGLMHQKILLIDAREVWISSANWTPDSLGVHENTLVGFCSQEFAQSLLDNRPLRHFTVGGQELEFWELPSKEALERLLQLIEGARHHLRVAMYAFSNPRLVEACINAHRRGVKVELILDRQMSHGVSKRAIARLEEAGLPLRLYAGMGILHSKLAWIDNQLIHGSANWTEAAFKRNEDCFLIIHNLNEIQNKALKHFWKIAKATSCILSPSALISGGDEVRDHWKRQNESVSNQAG